MKYVSVQSSQACVFLSWKLENPVDISGGRNTWLGAPLGKELSAGYYLLAD